MEETVRLCEEALKNNKCVVIGLQSTGEANIQQELYKSNHKEEFDEFLSTAKFVCKHKLI